MEKRKCKSGTEITSVYCWGGLDEGEEEGAAYNDIITIITTIVIIVIIVISLIFFLSLRLFSDIMMIFYLLSPFYYH